MPQQQQQQQQVHHPSVQSYPNSSHTPADSSEVPSNFKAVLAQLPQPPAAAAATSAAAESVLPACYRALFCNKQQQQQEEMWPFCSNASPALDRPSPLYNTDVSMLDCSDCCPEEQSEPHVIHDERQMFEYLPGASVNPRATADLSARQQQQQQQQPAANSCSKSGTFNHQGVLDCELPQSSKPMPDVPRTEASQVMMPLQDLTDTCLLDFLSDVWGKELLEVFDVQDIELEDLLM